MLQVLASHGIILDLSDPNADLNDIVIWLGARLYLTIIANVESNQKAKIIRDACTGCRLCVLACPTDAISMIDR